MSYKSYFKKKNDYESLAEQNFFIKENCRTRFNLQSFNIITVATV